MKKRFKIEIILKSGNKISCISNYSLGESINNSIKAKNDFITLNGCYNDEIHYIQLDSIESMRGFNYKG